MGLHGGILVGLGLLGFGERLIFLGVGGGKLSLHFLLAGFGGFLGSGDLLRSGSLRLSLGPLGGGDFFRRRSLGVRFGLFRGSYPLGRFGFDRLASLYLSRFDL